jgi:hypothetical protein
MLGTVIASVAPSGINEVENGIRRNQLKRATAEPKIIFVFSCLA